MASYALLPALSGFEFDMVSGHIGFAPLIAQRTFRCFWSLDCAWGTYERAVNRITLRVEQGTLTLRSFGDSLLVGSTHAIVEGVREDSVTATDGRLQFAEPLTLAADSALRLSVDR
jgi:hypothetical protein